MVVYPIIKLKYPFEIVEVGGKVQAVPTREGTAHFHGVIFLHNDSARFIFEKLIGGITLPDLMMACLRRYEGSNVDEVGKNVTGYLDALKERGLLTVDPTRGVRYDGEQNEQ